MKYVDRFIFKARCSAILNEVQATGEIFVVTKDGKPYVRLEPFRGESAVKELADARKLSRTERKKTKPKAR